ALRRRISKDEGRGLDPIEDSRSQEGQREDLASPTFTAARRPKVLQEKPIWDELTGLLVLEDHHVPCLLHHVAEDSLVPGCPNRSVVNVMVLVSFIAPRLAEDQLVILHSMFLKPC